MPQSITQNADWDTRGQINHPTPNQPGLSLLCREHHHCYSFSIAHGSRLPLPRVTVPASRDHLRAAGYQNHHRDFYAGVALALPPPVLPRPKPALREMESADRPLISR